MVTAQQQLPPSVINALLSNAITSRREECRADFFTFFKVMWSTVCEEKYKYNWHHKYLCRELQKVGMKIVNREEKEYDLVINIPPGETKSIIVNQLFPVWLWVQDPTIRIISTSHGKELSTFNAMKSKDCLRSELFNLLFDEIELKEDMSGKGHYMNDHGGERLATSVESKITGFHAHIRIYDDLVDANLMDSSAQINMAKGHMDAMSSRSTDEKITTNIMIMQRLAVNDPTTYALEKWGVVKQIVLPAEDKFEIKPAFLKRFYIKQGGLLNPQRKDRAILKKKFDEVGSIKYNAQFGQKTERREGKLIHPGMFDVVTEIELFTRFSDEDRRSFLVTKKYATADLAYTVKTKNDPSGILIFKYWNNFFYLLDFHEWRKEAPDLVNSTKELYINDDIDRVQIENKASGLSIAQTLRRKGVNAVDYKQSNVDKGARILDKQGFLESNRMVIVINSKNQARMNKFLDYLCAFPDETVPDEAVDTLEMAINSVLNKKRKWR
jgi:predicted phage terminase large subunit-like protein